MRFFILFIFTILLTGCDRAQIEKNKILNSQLVTHVDLTQTLENSRLPSIKIEGESYLPENSLSDEAIKTLIVKYLFEKDIKGINTDTLNIKNITPRSLWENSQTQLIQIMSEYDLIYDIAVIKDNSVVLILFGMPIQGTYLSDIDNDGIYDIFAEISLGSGIISNEIVGYNLHTKEDYKLSGRTEAIDYFLEVYEDKLYVKSAPMYGEQNAEEIKWGQLDLESNNKDKENKLVFIPFDLSGADKYKNILITNNAVELVYKSYPIYLNNQAIPQVAVENDSMQMILIKNIDLSNIEYMNQCKNGDILTFTFPEDNLLKKVEAFANPNTCLYSSMIYPKIQIEIDNNQIQFDIGHIKFPDYGVIYRIIAQWENGDQMIYEFLIKKA